MIENNPYIVVEWKNIARLTHYSGDWCRRKFGRELKDSGLVVIKWIWYSRDGKRCRKRVAVGVRHLLEHYFLAKRQAGEY